MVSSSFLRVVQTGRKAHGPIDAARNWTTRILFPMKRFTETTKWDDSWYANLSPQAKLLRVFLWDKCDNAGVVDPNLKLASFLAKMEITEEHLSELKPEVEMLPTKKVWISTFIKFQFGELSKKSLVHQSVMKLISTHSLPYAYPRHRIKEKDIEKEKEKDKVQEGGTGGRKHPTIEEVKAFCATNQLPESDAVWFWNKCEGNGWTNGGRPIKSWTHTISAWKAGGYMPSQKSSKGGENGKPLSIMDLKTVLQVKEQKAQQLKAKHTSDLAMGTVWNDEEAKKSFFQLRSEIKALQTRIEKMA